MLIPASMVALLFWMSSVGPGEPSTTANVNSVHGSIVSEVHGASDVFPPVPEGYEFHYFLDPNPELIPALIVQLDENEKLNLEHMFAAGFLSQVFRQNEDKLVDWATTFWQLRDSSREYLWLAIWFSNTETARTIVGDAAKRETESIVEGVVNLAGRTPALSIIERVIDSPQNLDLLWGCYFATGKDEYVVKIAECLPWTLEGHAVDYKEQLLGLAARWSIKSNALQHSHVLEICKSQIPQSTTEMQQVLQEIVDEVMNENE